MKDKLIQYIDLLFTGTPATQEVADLKEELTRNTLDRFDDLVQEGKTEEAAYNLAVAGIGDINELLQQMKQTAPQEAAEPSPKSCYTPPASYYTPPEKKRGLPALGRWLIAILWVLTTLLYLVVSFSTGAWHLTWLLFPIAGAASQVIRACFDLSRRIARFVVWLVVLVLLSALFAGLLPNKDYLQFGIESNFFFKDSDYNVGGTVLTEPVNELDITWINGHVTVETYDGTHVELTESAGSAGAEQLRWKLKNGRLTVYARKSLWFLQLFHIGDLPEKQLTLRIPAGTTLRDIEISAVSAAVELTDLQAGEIKIDQVSGNTTLSNVTGSELELDGTSGKLTCTDCSFRSLDYTTVSGDLAYTGSLSEAETDSVSGDVRIESSEMLQEIDGNSVSGKFRIIMPDGSGFTVETDSLSGDLSSDFPLTASGDSKTYGSGSAEYNFDSVSGDVALIQK